MTDNRYFPTEFRYNYLKWTVNSGEKSRADKEDILLNKQTFVEEVLDWGL